MAKDSLCKILEFKSEFLECVTEIVHQTIEKNYFETYSLEVVEYFKDYHSPSHIDEKATKGFTLCLFVDEKLAGTGNLSGNEIGGVYIHPDYQGKGYGKLIIAELFKKAKSMDISKLYLDATLCAYEFYLRFGFIEKKKVSQFIKNNAWLDYYEMEIVL